VVHAKPDKNPVDEERKKDALQFSGAILKANKAFSTRAKLQMKYAP
jgi:hypothetical protein